MRRSTRSCPSRPGRIGSRSRTLAVLLAIATGIGAASGGEPIDLAVVDFDTGPLESSWPYEWDSSYLSRAVADDLAARLHDLERFRIVERDELDRVLSQLRLDGIGRADPSAAARLGKMMDVDLLVLGSIREFEARQQRARTPRLGRWTSGKPLAGESDVGGSTLTARLVEVATARVLGSWKAEGTCDLAEAESRSSGLEASWNRRTASLCYVEAVERLADGIASAGFEVGPTTEPPEKRLETEGKIARVETDRIYLNVGSDAGVAPGDRFEILRLGEPILDPDTGEPLGADWLVAGTVEVTRVIGGRLSVAAPVSGGPFRVGDRAVSEGDRGSLPR